MGRIIYNILVIFLAIELTDAFQISIKSFIFGPLKVNSTTKGYSCMFDMQCILNHGTAMFCNKETGYCECKKGLKQVNGTICRSKNVDPSRELKIRNCFTNVQCKLLADYDSYCGEHGVCICPKNWISTNKNGCIKKEVKKKLYCREDKECVKIAGKNSYCQKEDDICACKSGFKPSKNGCVKIISSVLCFRSSSCQEKIGENSYCSYSFRCKCERGYERNSTTGKCERVMVTGKCLNHVQCMYKKKLYAICMESGQCGCQQNYVSSNYSGYCIPEKCKSDKDCGEFRGNNSLCDERGMCQCKEGFENRGRDFCTKKIPSEQKECSEHKDCMSEHGKDSLCSLPEGNCMCKDGFEEDAKSGICEKIVVDKCTTDSFCKHNLHNNSFCNSESRCECGKGLVKSQDGLACELVPITPKGIPCDSNDKCLAGFDFKSYCSSSGSCKCMHGFTLKETGCVMNMVHKCQEHSECFSHIGNDSKCSEENICICKDGFDFLNGYHFCQRVVTPVVMWVRNMSATSLIISIVVVSILVLILVFACFYFIYTRCYKQRKYIDLDDKNQLKANMANYPPNNSSLEPDSLKKNGSLE